MRRRAARARAAAGRVGRAVWAWWKDPARRKAAATCKEDRRRASRYRVDARRTRWRNRLAALRRPGLTIAGLACISAAAWAVHLVAGLAIAGVSFLLLEWLTRPTPGGAPR